MTQTLIKDATIINEGRSFTGSVIIEGDKIAKVIEGTVVPEETYSEIIDAKGKYLIPGVIDDHAPAELFQINNRGYIREGYQADLVIVNPNTRWTLTKEAVLSKCGWSPLENYSFSNKFIWLWKLLKK